jgi:quercetin dioxygenase-like cupin family protein
MNSNALPVNFIENDDISWEEVEKGIYRKIMAYDEKLMFVKVKFEPGKIGNLHRHPHTQISQVESGIFEIEIGGLKKRLKKGDAYYVPPDTLHGAECIEAGVLIDVFSPMREDFIQ